MAYLDLEEAARLVGRGRALSNRRLGVGSFLRKDRLFSTRIPLDEEVRRLIHRECGERPSGPIRVLTQLRWLGYYFSPLNLYYAFDESGEHVRQVLAEVNNTPWGERHCYVLCEANRTGADGELRFEHDKEFHVSPFMGMEALYRWRLSEPGETLRISLGHVRQGALLFDANLVLKRRPLTRREMRRAAARYPLMTAQISAAIYYQALRLWWKRCPYYAHPKKNLVQTAASS